MSVDRRQLFHMLGIGAAPLLFFEVMGPAAAFGQSRDPTIEAPATGAGRPRNHRGGTHVTIRVVD